MRHRFKRPSRSMWTHTRRAVAAIVLAATVAGCEDVYRTNHRHSEENQKLVDKAVDSFESFAGETAGLGSSLLKNVETRRQLENAVGATRSRVHDIQAAVLTTDMTWERLRLETYVQLGLLQYDEDPGQPPRPLNLTDAGDLAYARLRARDGGLDDLLAERITTREMKVTAIAKVLELIGQGHRVIVEETNKKLKKTEEELAKLKGQTSPPASGSDGGGDATDDPTGDARIAWVRELFQHLVDARAAYQRNPEILKTANELQRKLLAEIETSRDPVEAAALVPVVGTGLSDFDFEVLDAYVIRLATDLDELDRRIRELDRKAGSGDSHGGSGGGGGESTGTPSEARASWDDLERSLCEARVWVQVAVYLVYEEKDPNNQFAGPGTRRRWSDRGQASRQDAALYRSLRPASAAKRDLVERARQRLQDLLAECAARTGGGAAGGAAAPPAERAERAGLPGKADTPRASFSALRQTRIGREAKALKLPADTADLLRRAQELTRGRDGSVLKDTINGIRRTRQSVQSAASKSLATASAIATAAPTDASPVAATGMGAMSAQVAAGLAQVAARRANLAVNARRELSNARGVAAAGDQPRATKERAATDAEGIARELAGISNSGLTDLDAEKGFQLINQFLGLDAKVAGFIDDAVKNKTISEGELKWLGGVVTDIANEQTARHERILTFLSDLYGAGVDLGNENARHAQGMLTVSNLELRRWALIGDLNQNYQDVFVANPTGDSSLFADRPTIDRWNNGLPQPGGGSPPELRRHPLVHGPNLAADADASDQLLITIRELAETAKAWHDSPQVSDPTGLGLRRSNDRLFKAVRTVDGHLLLVSLNQHMSEENVVRLRAELASHDVRLDTLKTRVEEAGYRMTLGDLRAFHASGITDQDIQTIADVFSSGFLAWIGSGVNSGGAK